jgi:uncharacterized membrane-anchored protein
MKNKIIISVFSCLVLLQIATPLSMIMKRESTLKEGTLFRFKTAPVDPFDAFRGRYVALQIEESRVSLNKVSPELEHGQNAYAHIVVDKDGFAKISQVTALKPKGAPYLSVRIGYKGTKDMTIDFPIDRYYMEENAAPRAEKLYRRHSRQDAKDAYVTVKIKDGFGVIEGLYVAGQKIEDLIKAQGKR